MKKWIPCGLAVLLFGLNSQGRADELFTHVYVVPPTFPQWSSDDSNHWQPKPKLYPEGHRRTAQQVFEDAGIVFGDGALAFYNSKTHQVTVRNTKDQLSLVEQFIDTKNNRNKFRAHVSVQEAEIPTSALSELLFGPDQNTKEEERSKVTFFLNYEGFEEDLESPPQDLSDPLRLRLYGILTEKQFSRAATIIEGESPVSEPVSALLESRQPVIIQKSDRRFGVIAEFFDEFSIDVSLFFPPAGAPLSNRTSALIPDHRYDIWSGQTMVFGRDIGEKTYLAFIRGEIVDEAGLPLSMNKEGEKPKIVEPRIPLDELPRQERLDEAEALADKASRMPTQEELERIQESDSLGAQAKAALDAGEIERARDLVGQALIRLPDHPLTATRRERYAKMIREHFLQSVEKSWEAPRDEDPPSHHVVAQGDSAVSIAKQYGMSPSEVYRLNGIKEGAAFSIGQLLQVSPQKTYSTVQNLLKETIIRELDFQDVRLVDAILAIKQRMQPAKMNLLFPDVSPKFVLQIPKERQDAKITLRLHHVPAEEALRYLTSLAGCSFRVKDDVIYITEVHDTEGEA